jgi:hypothetical protein
MRSLLLTLVGLSLGTGTTSAWAAGPCNEALSECREDCLIEFGGSTALPMKKKYDRCLGKCVKTASLCTERALEVDRNQLDEGSLDKSPGSREVDSDGFSTAPKASNKKTDGDAFDTASTPKRTAPSSTGRESPPLAPPLSQSEIPKSTRSELAVDPKTVPEPKPPAPSDTPESSPRAASASDSVPAVPKKADALKTAPATVETKKAAEAERRDDLKPAPTATAEPVPVQRKTVAPKPEKKRDDDDLRNF